MCNIFWFCCYSVPKFSLNFSFSLRCRYSFWFVFCAFYAHLLQKLHTFKKCALKKHKGRQALIHLLVVGLFLLLVFLFYWRFLRGTNLLYHLLRYINRFPVFDSRNLILLLSKPKTKFVLFTSPCFVLLQT